jgi:hypothetical protein
MDNHLDIDRPIERQALNELVDELMDGHDIGYGHRKVDLFEMLHEIEAKGESDLPKLIIAIHSGFFLSFEDGLHALLRRHLNGSNWHRIRIAHIKVEEDESYGAGRA